MLKRINLNFGPKGLSSKLEFEPTKANLFIGPNNSGKSKAIVEIESFINKGMIDPSFLIINEIDFEIIQISDIVNIINELSTSDQIIDENYIGQVNIGKITLPGNSYATRSTQFDYIKNNLSLLNLNPDFTQTFASFLTSLFVLYIAGNTRFNLLVPNEIESLLEKPKNYLSHIFQNNELRENIRKTLFKAFKKYFVLDPTTLGKLQIKFSDIKPPPVNIEKGINDEAVAFYKNTSTINNFSDGVKAFTSILIALKAIEPKVLIIDEPEAFLHPSLATMIGKEIGTSLQEKETQFYAATHSSNFLMGLVSSGTPINLIRLTYLNEFPTARILPKEKIVKLMRDPLLRSTGVLNGLFYEAVVVTEGDSDRAFYQEINERLLTYKPEWGIQNCLFLNAQNKQTINKIVKPLRELGIPAVGIVDIDVLKEGGSVWSKLTSCAFIPQTIGNSLNGIRRSLKIKFDEIRDSTGNDMKRNGGVQLLSGENEATFNSYCDQLQEYGVFVVRNGELESWLKDLGISGHGSEWLIKMFEKMKEDPSDDDYIKPSEIDVWKYIYEIKKWIENPERKGIPISNEEITS